MAKNMINGKAYIGQTIISLKTRKRQHMYDAFTAKKNHYFYKALRKYGEDSFSWNVLCECSSIDELNQKEIEFIAKFRSTDRDLGYNIKSGGLGGHHSEETKRKMSVVKLGYTHSEESKRKMSVAKSGTNHPNFGKQLSNDVRKKISNSHIGKKQTSESIEKIRQKKIGSHVSQETKSKISMSMTGRRVSQQARENMIVAQIKAKGKPILMLDKSTKDIIKRFDSVSDAVREFGAGMKSCIFRALKGSRKSACGFVWQYDEKQRLTKNNK